MIATLRTMTYSQLLSSVAGRRVAIWSCNTCARLCGLGGREAVEGLASRLRSDGVEVVRTDLVSASCLLERVRQTWEGEGDIIIPLACTEGIRVLRQVSGAKVLETCRTVGLGVHAGGEMWVTSLLGEGEVDPPISLEEAARRRGLHAGAFVDDRRG